MEKSAPARGETSSQTATYAERYVQGAFWSLTGTLGLRFFNFTANIVVARFLGQIGFGELAMIQSTIGFLETFSNLGLKIVTLGYRKEII
jgi:O-antigen/teichoic acid export membrane protein